MMARRARGTGSVVKLRQKEAKGKVRLSKNWLMF